jgi:hypothetical protein
MSDDTLPIPTGRTTDGRFGPGNPGKPPGARNRVRAQMSRILLADFVLHHPHVMAKLRYAHTLDYVKLMLAVSGAAEAELAEDEAPLAPLDLEAIADQARRLQSDGVPAHALDRMMTRNHK